MKHGVYCVCFRFPVEQNKQLADAIKKIKNTLTSWGVDYKEPNMGAHLTIIPPFYAEVAVGKALAFGLAMSTRIESVENRFCARSVSLGRFKHGNKISLVLKLEEMDGFISVLHVFRSMSGERWEYVHGNPRRKIIPHIEVAEVDNNKTNEMNLKNLDCPKYFSLLLPLSHIQVMKKVIGDNYTIWESL